MVCASVIRFLRDAHSEDRLKLIDTFAKIFPNIPAWSLMRLVEGKYDTDEKGDIIINPEEGD